MSNSDIDNCYNNFKTRLVACIERTQVDKDVKRKGDIGELTVTLACSVAATNEHINCTGKNKNYFVF